MKNGNFEMDDEEYMEALELRDEYRYAHKLNHNNPWWDELEELAKKGNIEEQFLISMKYIENQFLIVMING